MKLSQNKTLDFLPLSTANAMNLHRASAGAGLSSSISRAFRPRAASLFCSSGRSLNSLSQNQQATFSGMLFFIKFPHFGSVYFANLLAVHILISFLA